MTNLIKCSYDVFQNTKLVYVYMLQVSTVERRLWSSTGPVVEENQKTKDNIVRSNVSENYANSGRTLG